MKLDDVMPERVWLSEVVALAKGYGWLVYHAMPAQNARGRWATHQMGDTGFPDLLLTHHMFGTVFAELKTNKGVLTANQHHWIDTLSAAGQEVYIWRPRDRARMKLRLMGGRHGS